ncbi:unnamed protein product [Lupinus luteus]|uniref:Uncharacterized protein n=1 Tax=Lupinus luteus TaxID=3873 RepID=A0AAV1W683_LUPLU
MAGKILYLNLTAVRMLYLLTSTGSQHFLPDKIVIEERSPKELLNAYGGLGEQVAASGISVWNPTFDVTPANLISGVITEKGVITKTSAGNKYEFLKRESSKCRGGSDASVLLKLVIVGRIGLYAAANNLYAWEGSATSARNSPGIGSVNKLLEVGILEALAEAKFLFVDLGAA